jgi:hypothetical protein
MKCWYLSQDLTMLSADARNTPTDSVDVLNSTASVSNINGSNNCCLSAPTAGGFTFKFSSPWYGELLAACYCICIIAGGIGSLLVLILAFFRRSKTQVSPTGVF